MHKASWIFGIILAVLAVCLAYIPAQAYSYTEEELSMLAKTITAEAGTESMRGKIAIGNVVMNRVNYYNSSIGYILNVENQFSYSDGTSANAESIEAARRVLENNEWVVPTNCFYFKNSGPPDNGYLTWSGEKDDIRTFWGKIGSHYFYLYDPDGTGATGSVTEPPMYNYEYSDPQLGTLPTDEVVHIQELLITCGYELEADGYFGEDTDAAVKDFQTLMSVEANGIVDDETLALLEEEAENAAQRQKEAEEQAYLEQVTPSVTAIIARHRLIETCDDGMLNMISEFMIAKHTETLEALDYPVESLVFAHADKSGRAEVVMYAG